MDMLPTVNIQPQYSSLNEHSTISWPIYVAAQESFTKQQA